MGFLAPLYIAGLLAVGLPILFHLIRRTPQNRQVFSSLMFLQPSPPRLTRRSRLTNILLLILRALALTALAIAFARPFFANASNLDTLNTSGRRIAVLLDASASMRRGDVWARATAEADRVLGTVSPGDEVALYTFDRQVRPALTFDEWNQTEPGSRAGVARARLADLKPGWSETRVGDALATVADVLAESGGPNREADKRGRQVILISDLQQGGHAEALQGHQWPQNVSLDVRAVAPPEGGNATLQLVKQTSEDAERLAGKVRVRVATTADTTREQFSLTWANDRGPLPGVDPVKVYVAPGRSQILNIDWPATAAGPSALPDRLVLAGDASDFDNTLYVVPPRTDVVRVVYIGEDAADDLGGLRYYLQSALADTPHRRIEFVARRPSDALAEADLRDARLVVVANAPAADALARLKAYLQAGGDVFWVLRSAGPAKDAAALMGVDLAEVTEANGGGGQDQFALISRVDVNHPLFAPFADPRFGDFTKIHFWKHRQVKLAPGSDVAVLARFDRGDPFLLERPVGQGRMQLVTSGWSPGDSQLALSTKFVPLLEGLVRPKGGTAIEAQYPVGEPIALPAGEAAGAARTMVDPAGKRHDLPAGATVFTAADAPGIYRLLGGNVPMTAPATTRAARASATAPAAAENAPPANVGQVAVNIAPDEGQTLPLAAQDFAQYGAKLEAKPATEEQTTLERRLKLTELENRQKIWRWLIVGVLALLCLETALAGRLTRRAQNDRTNT
jgi:hypothetical protein